MTNFTEREFVVSAEHDGYTHMPGHAVHRRTWVVSSGTLEIRDEVYGQGKHTIELFFHLIPGVEVYEGERGVCLEWRKCRRKIAILRPDISVETFIEDSTYHPEFGKSYPSYRIVCKAKAELPCTLITRIEWMCS